MATPEKADGLRLSQVLWGGATLLGVLPAVAYAYSLAYLFRIEPQFISAFSKVDLILWAASSLYIVLAAVIGWLSVAGLAMGSLKFNPSSKKRAESVIKKGATKFPWRIIFLGVAAVLIILGAFLFGDYEGRAARSPQTKPRAWVCGDDPQRPGVCHPLVFIGSEKMVFADNGKFVLRKIEDRHVITSEGTPPYVPKRTN